MSKSDEGPLAGSVKYYEQHLAVCTGGPPELWLARVEQMNDFFIALTAALQARGLDRTIKLTACDAPTLSGDGFDLFLMPDMLRLPGLTAGQSERLADALLHRFERGLPFDVEPMAGGDHIFVCTHANRDARCGEWGEPFVHALRAEIEAQGAIAQVHRTSHIGGHRFAATCILYPQGIWYGNLRAEDAAQLVHDHLNHEMLLPAFYRGRLGVEPVQQAAEAVAARATLDAFGCYESLTVEVTVEGKSADAVAQATVRREGAYQVRRLRFPLHFAQGGWRASEPPQVEPLA